MSGRRPIRSASTPPPSMTRTCGKTEAANTRPSSAAVPPLSSTANVSAILDMAVPSSEVENPA